jgi:hypothetical protein
MQLLKTLVWLFVSFLTGIGLYLAVAPRPVLDAVVQELTGASEFDRCVQAARCLKAMQAPSGPNHFRMAPADLDRG